MILKKLLPVIQLACVVVLLGCRSESGSKTPADEIVVALSAPAATLDPRFATDATGMRIGNLLFQSLVRMGPELMIIGDAASNWTFDAKKLEYTFSLKAGLKFWDGTPVTADDIEFSIAFYRSERSPFRTAYSTIKKVQVTYNGESGKVVIGLTKFNAPFLTDLSPLKILPKKQVEKFGDDFGKNLLGSGPFKLQKADENEIAIERIEPNPIKIVRFKIIRDEATRYLKVLKGEIDLAQSELPFGKVVQLEKTGDFDIVKYPGTSMNYILLNLTIPAMKDLHFRRAIDRSINRPEIIKYKLEGFAEPATSILSPSNPFHNRRLSQTKFDPSVGLSTFGEFVGPGAEMVLKTSNAQTAVENGKVIVDQLSRAGLRVRLQSYEWGTFYGDIQKGNFEMATMKWVGVTDPDIYRVAFYSSEIPPNGRNRGYFSDPEFDKAVTAAASIIDPIERQVAYDKIQAQILDALPIIPLWYEQEVVVMNKVLQNYTISKFGDYSGLLNASKKVSSATSK